MKKYKQFILGFLSGAVIFGAVTAFALEVIPNPFPIKLDGKSVNIEGYNIDGKSYFQLRDIGNAVGFTVDWDAENNTVVMETEAFASAAPTPSATPIPNVTYDEQGRPETIDGLDIHYIDGVGYVMMGYIEQKFKAIGYGDYTFGTDILIDRNRDDGVPVIENVPHHPEYTTFIPVDYYESTLRPFIEQLAAEGK